MNSDQIFFARRAILTAGILLSSLPTSLLAQGQRTRQSMTMYRDAGCGCCVAWADLAEQAGYRMTVQTSTDMTAVKRRLGVPASLTSCHTALVGGFVIEGHVPFAAITQLLSQRPASIRGIAVPGMPVGSPGMELPGGRREPFDVIAFYRDGRTARFA